MISTNQNIATHYEFKTKFNPFVDGFQASDRGYFKNTFHALENVMRYDGKEISQQMQHCIDTRSIDQLEALKGQIISSVKAEKSEHYQAVADKLSTVIRKQYEDDVSVAFDEYLNKQLNPNGNISDTKLVPLKNKITALFSAKAFTALFSSAINPHVEKKHGGILMNEKADSAIKSCELMIPKNPKMPIQIIATIQSVFEVFQDIKNQQTIELANPICIKAAVIYAIERSGKVTATAKIHLPHQIDRSAKIDNDDTNWS